MKTWKDVNALLTEWKTQSLSKPEIVVKLANACIGWPYVYGGRGEECTPSNRRDRSNPNYPTIVSKCQVLSGKKDSCEGCQWYPDGNVLFFDCRGFTYFCFLKAAGIKINGAGATTQYETDSNWSEKGLIKDMPRDKVCCVFRYDKETHKYEHTLLYDGKGNYIHCSGEVKKCAMSKYSATHYAIPKGLYSNEGGGIKPVEEKATVYAQDGSTVNMRTQPDGALVERVPVGTMVDVTEHGDSWCKIKYNGKIGYMMTKFLVFGEYVPGDKDKDDEYVKVKKSDLTKAYTIIGEMLGVKG